LRDRKCLELLNEARIDVIKGNASEVARVSGESVKTRGVDATEVGGDLARLAAKLAEQRKATVVLTGKVDIVTDVQKTYLVKNLTITESASRVSTP
jgi:hydroxyethylthiazole kinase